ncbi:MAG: hypothetical protein IKA71_00710 [Lentisphaeria bacterium]|nr:hypothetical protein [Lentisphaeria bacterium]
MKNLILRIITAFSALRAGKVFAADNISVIASCWEDTDIITRALKVLKTHTGNAEHYNLVTENIRMILLSRNRHLPPFCVWHNKKQLVLRHDFIAGTTPLICASMLVNYACLLQDELPPYAVSAIDEQLRFLAAEDTASCQLMIDYYRELGHDFTFEL